MTTGVESDPHKAMVEAFELCLKKQFPNSRITLGRKVQPVGLKPDVYIRHSDGREWVYEMIRGNKSWRHLQQNHKLYQDAGIRDFWILWEKLAPPIELPNLKQGIISAFQDTPHQTKLNSLYRTILAAHSQNRGTSASILYAFTLNQMGQNVDNAPNIFRALSVGVDIFEYESDYQNKPNYRRKFLSLAEIGFDENGFIIPGPFEMMNDSILASVFQERGIDLQGGFAPAAVFSVINDLWNNPQAQEELLKAIMEETYKNLAPEEQAEIEEFILSSMNTPFQKMSDHGSSLDGDISLNHSRGIRNLSKTMKIISDHLDSQAIPESLKKLIIPYSNMEAIDSLAKTMQWQETSRAVKQAEHEEEK